MKIRKIIFSVIIVLMFASSVFAFPHDPNPSQIDGTNTRGGTRSVTNLFPGDWSKTLGSMSVDNLRLAAFMNNEFFTWGGGAGAENDLQIWNTPSFTPDKMAAQNSAMAYLYANPGSSAPATAGASIYTSQYELIDCIEAMPRTNLTVEYLGEIPRGFPFPILIFSNLEPHPTIPGGVKAKDRSPAELKKTKKPLVWIQGNIHGGEWSGGEGSLACAYDLAIGRYDNLLETVNVIVIPRVCADGSKVPNRETNDLIALQWTPTPQTRDLNRDNVLLDIPVTRAMRKLNMAYGPHFSVDLHERGFSSINSSITTQFGAKFDNDAGDIGSSGTTILQAAKELTYLRYKYMEPDLAAFGEKYAIFMGLYREGRDAYAFGSGTTYGTWSGYVAHPDDVKVMPARTADGTPIERPITTYGPYAVAPYNIGTWVTSTNFDADAPYAVITEASYNHRSSRNINSMPGTVSQLFENKAQDNVGARHLWERRVATGYICMLSTITTAANRGHEIVPQIEAMRARWIEKGNTYDPDDMVCIISVAPLPTFWDEKIDKGDGFPHHREYGYTVVDLGTTATQPNSMAGNITGMSRYDSTKAIKEGVVEGTVRTFTMGGRTHSWVKDNSGEGRYQPLKFEVTWQGWNLRERPRPTAYIFEGPYAEEVATRMLTAGIEVKRLTKDTVLDVTGWKYNRQPSVDFGNSGSGGWGTNNRDVTLYDVPGRLFEKDTYVVFLGQVMTNVIPMYMEPDLPFSAGNGIMLQYMSVALGGSGTGNLSTRLIGMEMPIYRYIGDVGALETYDMDYSLPLINRGAVARFFSFPTEDDKAALAEELGYSGVQVRQYDIDIQVHARAGSRQTAPSLLDGKFDMTLPTSKNTKEYYILNKDGAYEPLEVKERQTAGWDVATIVVADHGLVPWTVDLATNGRPVVGNGSNRTVARALPTWDDLIGVRILEIEAPSSITPFAVVEKLNGNKNNLTVTVVETYERGIVQFQETFSINNNAADTYAVGNYIVYVDTKGNDQIRECYIKEELENRPNAAPIVTPSARVEKLSGNTNNLFITVKEAPFAGAPVVFEAKFSISNNAAGTYKVGPYNVYVATKGNDKIEQCYIK